MLRVRVVNVEGRINSDPPASRSSSCRCLVSVLSNVYLVCSMEYSVSYPIRVSMLCDIVSDANRTDSISPAAAASAAARDSVFPRPNLYNCSIVAKATPA